MPGPVILRNAVDSYISEKYPTKNYSTVNKIYLENNASVDGRYAYLFFSKPFPNGVTIPSAKLRVWNGAAWPGSITLTVYRLANTWSGSKITWNNRPGTIGSPVSLTIVGAPTQTMWEIDISPIMQTIADGAPWYGLRLEISATSGNHWIYSTQSWGFRPELEVTWSDQPQAPETLSPSHGRAVSVAKPILSFDFTDHSGDQTIQACQVQIDPSNNFTTPAWDTITANPTGVPVDVPQLDLNTTSYPGLAEDATTWWRVRVKDGAGLWSDWSVSTQIKRDSFGTLTLTNPAAGASPYVEEPTPPITWTYTGHTQKAYQVIITKPNSSAILWTTGKTTSIATAVTIASGVLKDVAATYRLTLRVWDEVDREAEGGRPAYLEMFRDFTYQLSGSVTTVSALTAVQDNPWPWIKLTWSRGTAPDSFVIVRNGKVIDSQVLPSEALVSGTDYAYTDQLSPPRQNCVYEVRAVVNGQTSAGNPTASVVPYPRWSWLMRPDATDPIALLKLGSEKSPVVDPQTGTMQEMYEPVGGASPVLVTQYIRGYQGHVSAVLSDDILPGRTARDQRDSYKEFINEKGNTLLLYWVDEVMRVVCYNMIYQPQAYGGNKVRYVVEFDFFELED